MPRLQHTASDRRVTAPDPVAPAPTDDAALVARAKLDRQTFALLYASYFRRIYASCWRRLGDADAAADAQQTVLAMTPVVPGTTSLIATEEHVPLRAEPSTEARVLLRLAAGQLVQVRGSAIVTDGETWWPVVDPATDADGFVLEQLLMFARHELTFRGGSATLIDGTPVIVTPPPVIVPTVTPSGPIASAEPGATPNLGR